MDMFLAAGTVIAFGVAVGAGEAVVVGDCVSLGMGGFSFRIVGLGCCVLAAEDEVDTAGVEVGFMV